MDIRNSRIAKYMSRPLDPDWIRRNGLSQEIANVFMWRTGLFGFKLRSEMKKQQKSISRSEEMLSRYSMQHEALSKQINSVESEISSRFSGTTDDPDAINLRTKADRLVEEAESLVVTMRSYEDGVSRAQNSLTLLEDYNSHVVRNPDELMSRDYKPGQRKTVGSILDRTPIPTKVDVRTSGSDDSSE